MMKVSVCIPVYNAEKYLKETIDSVLNQSFHDFELVLINDCSTDDSVDVIRQYADPRIRFIQNEHNLGMHKTMDCCVEEAKGEYVLLLCDDDLIANDCLEKKARVLENDEKINLVFSASSVIDSHGKIIMKRRPYKANLKFDGKTLAKKSFETKNVFAEPSNVMFRKSAVTNLDGFDCDIKYAIDWDYWLRICSTGDVYYIDDYLSCFRISDTSETSRMIKIRKSIFEEDNYFVEKMRTFSALGFNERTLKKHSRNIKLRQYMKEIFFAIRR